MNNKESKSLSEKEKQNKIINMGLTIGISIIGVLVVILTIIISVNSVRKKKENNRIKDIEKASYVLNNSELDIVYPKKDKDGNTILPNVGDLTGIEIRKETQKNEYMILFINKGVSEQLTNLIKNYNNKDKGLLIYIVDDSVIEVKTEKNKDDTTNKDKEKLSEIEKIINPGSKKENIIKSNNKTKEEPTTIEFNLKERLGIENNKLPVLIKYTHNDTQFKLIDNIDDIVSELKSKE